MRKSILLILKLPPPVNGATTINNSLYESEKIKSHYNTFFIDHGLAQQNDDFGSIRIGKLFCYVKSLFECVFYLLSKEIDLCYITIAPKGLAFIKDSIYILLFKIFNKRYVIHLHGKGIYNNAKKSIIWKKYYQLIFNKSAVICLTENLTQDVNDVYNGIPFIVPNGIKESNYDSIKVDKEDKPVILFLSNLYIQKGILVFIEAIKRIAEQTDIQFEAWIVGNSTSEMTIEELQEKVQSDHISKWVRVLGPKFGINKILILKKADIFVFPTFNDTFGLVNLEAMEAGLPVITTNVGGIPEVIEDGVNGYIIEPQDINRLKDKIMFLLNHPDEINRISKNNKLKIHQNYTLEKFEDNMISVFRVLLFKKGNYGSIDPTT